MAELEIIDVHAHVFQNAETGTRYQQALGQSSPVRNGSWEEMLQVMKACGISKVVMLLYLPSTDMYDRRVPDLPREPRERAAAIEKLRQEIDGRITRYNEWGVQTSKEYPQLLAFVGADPLFHSKARLIEELEEKRAKGAKGVKLVPSSLRIYLNDPRLWPVYEFCERTGLPLLTQSGGGGRAAEAGHWDAWGRPLYLRYALEEFPKLNIIAAHFGRGYHDDTIDLARKYKGFHTDLSSQLGEWGEAGHWSIEEGAELIRAAGVEKVLFGTNYPGSDPAQYVDKLHKLPMKDAEIELIAGGNAKRVIGIA